MATTKRPVVWYALAGVIGLFLLGLKLVYSFFPYFNVTDVVVFALVGGASAHFNPDCGKSSALAASLPATLLCLAIVWRLGLSNLSTGVGTGWLISAFLIPASALGGAVLGEYLQRRSRSKQPSSNSA